MGGGLPGALCAVFRAPNRYIPEGGVPHSGGAPAGFRRCRHRRMVRTGGMAMTLQSACEEQIRREVGRLLRQVPSVRRGSAGI